MRREGGKELLSYRGGSRDLKPQRQSPKEGEGDKWKGYLDETPSGRSAKGNWLVLLAPRPGKRVDKSTACPRKLPPTLSACLYARCGYYALRCGRASSSVYSVPTMESTRGAPIQGSCLAGQLQFG